MADEHLGRLILFDVDGTLVDEVGMLFRDSLDLISYCASEMAVALCSARPFPSLRTLCVNIPGISVVAASQGAIIAVRSNQVSVRAPWDVVQAIPLAESEIQTTISVMRHQPCELFYHGLDAWFVHEMTRAASREAEISGVLPQVLGLGVVPGPIYKMVAVFGVGRTTDGLSDTLGRAGIRASCSKPGYLEMSSKAASASKGAEEIQHLLGLSSSHTFAVGDGENDIGLFQSAHRSFTFRKAPAAARQFASCVLQNPEQGGLVELRRLLESR